MSHADQIKYKIEAEGDIGHIQQISGGFGDTNHLDDDTIRMLAK